METESATNKPENVRDLCQWLKVTADVCYGNKDTDAGRVDAWQCQSNPWAVTLKFQGRRMTVPFWTGSAITEEPDAATVLDCLLSDYSAGDLSFEDFCTEFGYDTDSRKAERTHRACVSINRRLSKFLGASLDRFLLAERL